MSDFDYTLIHSKRRTMALELTAEGALLVRAPYGVSPAMADRFVAAHADWIRKKQQSRPRLPDFPSPTAEQCAALSALLSALIAEYRPKMTGGASYTGFRLTSAKKRFGSCSPATGRLCFAKQLVFYPADAVRYVVVHELAHLRYPNHSPAFHAYVASVFPTAAAARSLLRRQNAAIPAAQTEAAEPAV